MLKKLRRRIRKKGTFSYNPEENAAKRLIYSNFGLGIKEPWAKREGQMRARDREDSVKRQEHPEVMTRQRKRNAHHLAENAIRTKKNAHCTIKKIITKREKK